MLIEVQQSAEKIKIPLLYAFVDIQQLILVCNEASDWSTAFSTVSLEGDRTQGKFCFVHLENLLRTVTSG